MATRPAPKATSAPAPIGIPVEYVQPHDEGAFWFDAAQGDPSEFGAASATKYSMPFGEMADGTRLGAPGGDAYGWTAAGGGQSYYSKGDEYAPANWGPETISGIQGALDAAGYLSGAYIDGAWDPKSSNAFEKVLALANSLGVTWQDALRMGTSAEAASKGGGGRGGGGGGGGLGSAGPTDDDIRAVLNKTAQGVLGRNLRDDELGAGLSAFRSGLGAGTSPTVVAENVVRAGGPESNAHDVGNVLGVLQQLLGGK